MGKSILDVFAERLLGKNNLRRDVKRFRMGSLFTELIIQKKNHQNILFCVLLGSDIACWNWYFPLCGCCVCVSSLVLIKARYIFVIEKGHGEEMKARLHQEELPCKCINKCSICYNSYIYQYIRTELPYKCINKCSSKCSNSSTNESTKGCHDKCINKWSQCSIIDASIFMGTTFC